MSRTEIGVGLYFGSWAIIDKQRDVYAASNQMPAGRPMRPIIVMSSERSGSNLTRRVIGSEFNCSSPPANHLFHRFAPLTPWYGELGLDSGYERLADDIAGSLALEGPYQWAHSLRGDEIRSEAPERSLAGLVAGAYRAYALREGDSAWACKQIRLFDFAFEVMSAMPDAFFIYLVRDPRDVFASSRRAGHENGHPYYFAAQWRREQLAAIRAYQAAAAGGNAVRVHYEDLARDPSAVFRIIARLSGLERRDDESRRERDARFKQEANRSAAWKNIAQEPFPDSIGRYRKDTRHRDIRCLESVAGDVMQLLGYEPVTEYGSSIGKAQRAVYRLQNSLWNRAKRQDSNTEKGVRDSREYLNRCLERERTRMARAAGRNDAGRGCSDQEDAHANTK